MIFYIYLSAVINTVPIPEESVVEILDRFKELLRNLYARN